VIKSIRVWRKGRQEDTFYSSEYVYCFTVEISSLRVTGLEEDSYSGYGIRDTNGDKAI
jgi:hypothetical protein